MPTQEERITKLESGAVSLLEKLTATIDDVQKLSATVKQSCDNLGSVVGNIEKIEKDAAMMRDAMEKIGEGAQAHAVQLTRLQQSSDGHTEALKEVSRNVGGHAKRFGILDKLLLAAALAVAAGVGKFVVDSVTDNTQKVQELKRDIELSK